MIPLQSPSCQPDCSSSTPSALNWHICTFGDIWHCGEVFSQVYVTLDRWQTACKPWCGRVSRHVGTVVECLAEDRTYRAVRSSRLSSILVFGRRNFVNLLRLMITLAFDFQPEICISFGISTAKDKTQFGADDCILLSDKQMFPERLSMSSTS